jgi:hypothetical protein
MPLDSYPAPPGNKLDSIADIPINGAYTAITTGTPPTGGISITASQFGLQYIEWAQAIGSDNGQYDGVIYLNPLTANKPATSMRLQLIVAATGAEASGTIAAGRTMRIYAKGY